MRVYYYFACDSCQHVLCSIVDNPNGHVKCPNCGKDAFHKITKKEYDYVKWREETNVS